MARPRDRAARSRPRFRATTARVAPAGTGAVPAERPATLPHRTAQRSLICLRTEIGRADEHTQHTGDERPQMYAPSRH